MHTHITHVPVGYTAKLYMHLQLIQKSAPCYVLIMYVYIHIIYALILRLKIQIQLTTIVTMKTYQQNGKHVCFIYMYILSIYEVYLP